ncbi:hypothetical protein [Actinoplanes sp. NPDC051494]|uniref:hypothetical protein n=1 Tax=Actinoplanes sp. NPDC051494 TaxID=3363907 RepID=UPI003796619A
MEGVRPDAATLTGIDQVEVADVSPLLPDRPSSRVRPWVVVGAVVRDRTGSMSVDPGDGILRHVIDFAVLRLDRPGPGGDRPARCPHCDRSRVRRYAAFDLCPDCGWHAQSDR